MFFKPTIKGVFVGLSLFLFCQCAEKFNEKDPTDFNRLLAAEPHIETAKELILLYYPFQGGETPPPKITVDSLKNQNFLITLVDDYLADDAQKATKVIMEAERQDTLWRVNSIRVNFRCWPGRGHRNWGIAPCH